MTKQATAKAEPSAGKARKRAVSKTAPRVVTEAAEQTSPPALSHEEIAQHAYGIYLARGAAEGGEINDWLHAEHALRAQAG